MDVPYKELKQVILNLTENDDPVLHKATVDKHFLPTASFLHPIVNVKSAPDSRETIKKVYAVYKVLTKDVKIYFQNITIDLENTRAVVELEESVSASFVPFGLLHVERVKIITVLDLVKEKRDGKYYISRQYDVVPLDKLPTLFPFGFVYGWWQGLCTFTGSVVGGGMQMVGLW